MNDLNILKIRNRETCSINQVISVSLHYIRHCARCQGYKDDSDVAQGIPSSAAVWEEPKPSGLRVQTPVMPHWTQFLVL